MSSAWSGLINNRQVTELPHYAINKSLPEDTFFTDRGMAKHCFDVFLKVCKEQSIDLQEYTFIEPSAGEGCFYNLLPKESIGLDINPRNNRIQKANYLTWYPEKKGKYAVIGNPPFGVRGAMALAFLNRSLLFADLVAFILPMSFYSNGKGSNMKRAKGASLVHSEKLPSEAFYIPDTYESVAVNTVFQVWIKGVKKKVFTDYVVSEYVDIYTCCSSPQRYCGSGRGRNYDCFIASSFYKNVKVVNNFQDVLYGSGYGIIIKKKKQEIMEALEKADWTKFCSDATNHCRHIRMYHIRKLLGSCGFGLAI